MEIGLLVMRPLHSSPWAETFLLSRCQLQRVQKFQFRIRWIIFPLVEGFSYVLRGGLIGKFSFELAELSCHYFKSAQSLLHMLSFLDRKSNFMNGASHLFWTIFWYSNFNGS